MFIATPVKVLRRPFESALHTAIAVMDETVAPNRAALMQRLVQCVQHEAGVSRAGGAPADDAPRKGVDDKGDIDEAGPGRDKGEVGYPQGVWARRRELPINAIERARGRRIADCGTDPRTTPCRPILRIRRATVQRATAIPSRPSCRQTLRTP
jgi:hypothetical protein